MGACGSLPFWTSARSVWLGHCRLCMLCRLLCALGGAAGSPWQPALQGGGVWYRSHRWLCLLFGLKMGKEQKVSWTQETVVQFVIGHAQIICGANTITGMSAEEIHTTPSTWFSLCSMSVDGIMLGIIWMYMQAKMFCPLAKDCPWPNNSVYAVIYYYGDMSCGSYFTCTALAWKVLLEGLL